MIFIIRIGYLRQDRKERNQLFCNTMIMNVNVTSMEWKIKRFVNKVFSKWTQEIKLF